MSLDNTQLQINQPSDYEHQSPCEAHAAISPSRSPSEGRGKKATMTNQPPMASSDRGRKNCTFPRKRTPPILVSFSPRRYQEFPGDRQFRDCSFCVCRIPLSPPRSQSDRPRSRPGPSLHYLLRWSRGFTSMSTVNHQKARFHDGHDPIPSPWGVTGALHLQSAHLGAYHVAPLASAEPCLTS